jgi:type II secretory pathway component GspD/PulD (secretin)
MNIKKIILLIFCKSIIAQEDIKASAENMLVESKSENIGLTNNIDDKQENHTTHENIFSEEINNELPFENIFDRVLNNNAENNFQIHDLTADKQNGETLFQYVAPSSASVIPQEILDRGEKVKTLINFNIQGNSLYDVIIALSELKKINILIPSFIEADKIIINFALGKNIPIEEVEEYLLYFINMAGFILTLQDNVFIIAKKTDDHLRRYNLPLYVNPQPGELPDNPSYVRVIYFLKKIKIPLPSGGSESIKQILFNCLPDKTNGISVDPKTNSMMIIGPANVISNALLLIDSIDQHGDPECVTVLRLMHANGAYVNKLIEELLQVAKDNNANPVNTASYTGGFYFSPQVRTVLDAKTNSIVFVGKEDAIKKIITFIKEHIDLPEPQGNLAIHVYELKYLEAKKIAPILQDFVNGASSTQGEQSIKEKNGATIYRKFDNVRIIPEEIVPVKRTGLGNQQTTTKLNLGGNRLIIAATLEDYKELEKILDSLDQFQPTIILEMIIFDFEENILRNFSSDTRLPKYFNLPMGAQIQSLMMDNSMVVLQNPGIPQAITSSAGITPVTSMSANLLAEYSQGGDGGQVSSLANNTARNGLIISLGENDPNTSIWSILQLQEDIVRRSLIEHPTIVTQNNVPIKIQNIVVKRGAGELSPNNTQYGGATVVNINSYTAALAIELVPHISFGSCLNNNKVKIQLEINVSMEDFKTDNPADFTKLNRSIRTNATVQSGDILVIGGLHKESLAKSTSKVPFLGDIPLLGGLFRQTRIDKVDSNLVFCIRPVVVENEDQLRAYTDAHTNHYKSELSENCFTNCYSGKHITLKNS